MSTGEGGRETRAFSWQQWLTEGLQHLAAIAETSPLPPQFWYHLGQALCEAGEALRILSAYLQETAPEDLLETYGRLLDENTRLGQWPESSSQA